MTVLMPWTRARAESLRGLLEQRSAENLKKPILNVPPGPMEYPEWLLGDWTVSKRFAGYEITATKIPKTELVKNIDIPGFQKLTIADIADVGSNATFQRRYVRKDGKIREDRALNLKASIDGHYQREVVDDVKFDDRNPNRATIRLSGPASRNADRIELFTNARRSDEDVDENLFLTAESIRQVTYGPPTINAPGVPRIVIGEYQHFYTYHQITPDYVQTNLLTAVYIEPQDAMFPSAFDEAVIVYSEDLDMRRR